VAAETEATRGPRGRAGFTLIEVLIAMVILSVGLLALEGLAIGASRRVATANRLTEFTLIATHELETTLEGLRKSPVVNPGDDAWDLPNGTEVARVVEGTVQGEGTMYDVQVTVTPPTSTLDLRPVTVTGRVWGES
jgi:prepilin-type N-terminal cleavage/methylation domain-containing protein